MVTVGATKQRILREIQDGGVYGWELRKTLGLPISTVYEHLGDLRAAKLVEVQVKGRRRVYRLTERGRKLLEVFDD